ncbi:hypothetical protein [Streptomyces sp. NTH33]|uniref:hypothetical protein n=1 Tax=Streptomyces sp. NTH33 TaxID=1735453 RepID=UPI001C64BA25|nr:hypothetical protein [Streptomyces sp. NTH33]
MSYPTGIDPRVEAAARMCGARTPSVLLRALAPPLVPGILAASVLVLARTVGMFEPTFLTAGPDSQTLVVALCYAVFSAGIRTQQSIDAMPVMYAPSLLVLLVIALRFVDPTQLVTRVKEDRTGQEAPAPPRCPWGRHGLKAAGTVRRSAKPPA